MRPPIAICYQRHAFRWRLSNLKRDFCKKGFWLVLHATKTRRYKMRQTVNRDRRASNQEAKAD
tara:strand:+ start:1929 stop:2117 length:189 start_codon:yes stop_codon:yes gene_type:complete